MSCTSVQLHARHNRRELRLLEGLAVSGVPRVIAMRTASDRDPTDTHRLGSGLGSLFLGIDAICEGSGIGGDKTELGSGAGAGGHPSTCPSSGTPAAHARGYQRLSTAATSLARRL